MTFRQKLRSATKMVVRNLGPGTTSEAVGILFQAHGTVRSVRLMTDVMTGRCSGVAYVTLDEPVAGSACLALNGSDYEGRVIRVSVEKKTRWGVGASSGDTV